MSEEKKAEIKDAILKILSSGSGSLAGTQSFVSRIDPMIDPDLVQSLIFDIEGDGMVEVMHVSSKGMPQDVLVTINSKGKAFYKF